MRKKKLQQLQMVDMQPSVIKNVVRHGYEIAGLALQKLFPGEVIFVEELTTGYETVKYHSEPVYTIRYKGKILCRRYSDDLLGVKYRFESPIFETEKQ